MKNYKVNYLDKELMFNENFRWDLAECDFVSEWPWHNANLPSPPVVNFSVLYSNKYLYVKFIVKEKFIRAQFTELNSPVCKDSCVEFFVSPNSKGYFNFEVNCIGTIHLKFGPDRHNRIPVSKELINLIEINTTLKKAIPIENSIEFDSEYTVAYKIPFLLFNQVAKIDRPSSGTVWKANFYKCGDETKEPSWGCWNKVLTEQPDFHRPEYFGNLTFA